MMSAAPDYIEKRVAAVLKASPAVSDICDGKIYPLKIPQGTTLPCVVYQRVYSSPDHTLCGYASEGVFLMLNCFAMSYEQAKELALAVRGSMAAADCIFQNETDLYEENAETFCVSAEYFCQQHGGYCHG